MGLLRKYLVILLLMISNIGFAQFWIGPKIGLQGYTTKFKFSEAREEFKNRPGFGYVFGAAISANLKPTFSIVGEFQFSRKGKTTENKGAGLKNISVYNFLEAPIMLRYIFEEFQYEGVSFRPYIQIGPNFSYWLGGKGVIQSPTGGLGYRITFDESDTLSFDKMAILGANRFMWGLELGGGVILNVKQNQMLLIDLRLHLGHTFFGDKDGARINLLGFSDNLEQHYRLLNLSAVYFFEVDLRKLRQGKSTVNRRPRR